MVYWVASVMAGFQCKCLDEKRTPHPPAPSPSRGEGEQEGFPLLAPLPLRERGWGEGFFTVVACGLLVYAQLFAPAWEQLVSIARE